MKNYLVEQIQKCLIRANYRIGKADGILGPLTKNGILNLLMVKYPTGIFNLFLLYYGIYHGVRSIEHPLWLNRGMSHLGQVEVKGRLHNMMIVGFWQKIKAVFRDDETPWCAAFVGAMLENSGIKSTRSAAARSYLKFGTEIKEPCVGAIVVFWRGKKEGWSGHVGFVVGKTQQGDLVVLGGNQKDSVCLSKFKKDRVLGYFVPTGYENNCNFELETYDLDSDYSKNEQ